MLSMLLNIALLYYLKWITFGKLLWCDIIMHVIIALKINNVLSILLMKRKFCNAIMDIISKISRPASKVKT